jgi:hypothetical protein
MEHPVAVNEDFNLSTDEGVTVRELAGVIWRKVRGPGVPLRLLHDEPFEYDVQQRVPEHRQGQTGTRLRRHHHHPRPDARRGHPLDQCGVPHLTPVEEQSCGLVDRQQG